jgi:hypothetical protein
MVNRLIVNNSFPDAWACQLCSVPRRIDHRFVADSWPQENLGGLKTVLHGSGLRPLTSHT